jgi:Protein of unknown function (DUF2971)
MVRVVPHTLSSRAKQFDWLRQSNCAVEGPAGWRYFGSAYSNQHDVMASVADSRIDCNCVLRFTTMRAHKFLCAKYGLDSIEKKRLKQSRVSDLNDPFELMSYDVTNLVIRKTFEQTRYDVDKAKGLLCFSADWKDPVIWAHYGDKHRGLCLGFEITQSEESDYVKYVSKLLPFPSNFDEMSNADHRDFARAAIFTKFKHWSYEKEIGVWGPLVNEDQGLYFVPFDDKMRLVEVVMGSRCSLLKEQIVQAVGSFINEWKFERHAPHTISLKWLKMSNSDGFS